MFIFWFSDNATKQLLSQDQDLKRNHEDLQQDLASIRIKAKEVWDKLGEFRFLP